MARQTTTTTVREYDAEGRVVKETVTVCETDTVDQAQPVPLVPPYIPPSLPAQPLYWWQSQPTCGISATDGLGRTYTATN